MTTKTSKKKSSGNVLETIKAYEKYLDTQYKRKNTLLEKEFNKKKEQLIKDDADHEKKLDASFQEALTQAKEEALKEAEKITHASKRKAMRFKEKSENDKARLADQFIKRFVEQ